MSHLPPKWPVRVLRSLVRSEFMEEIEGDLEEIHQANVERFGASKARRLYTWEVVRLIRPVLIKNLRFVEKIQSAMLLNYVKVSVRGLLKNPINASINIVGLACAIGFCIFAYAFTRWTLSTDQFHENKETVFLVTSQIQRDSIMEEFGTSPRPLGELIRLDLPAVSSVCRIENRNVIVKQHDQVFQESVRLTDPEFLSLFTFPLQSGLPSSIRDLNSVILSDRMASKYFGSGNPVGQTITVIFGPDNRKEFKVTGVAAPFPDAFSFAFDFLIHIDNLKTAESYDSHRWPDMVSATFVQLHNPGERHTVIDQLSKYAALQRQTAKPDQEITQFNLKPLSTLHREAEFIRDSPVNSSGSNYTSIYFMVVLSLFILALACFNYMNIAIVTASRRLKEIGVRKTIGASRVAVVTQFLSENIVVTLFAMVFGVVLAATIFIPGFEFMWHFDTGFSFADPILWAFLPALVVITGILSGAYPAFYISRFETVTIMKGTLKFGQRNPLTRTLLFTQLIFACAFIAIAVTFPQNNAYVAQRSWGYEHKDLIYAHVANAADYERLKTEVSQFSNVTSTAGGRHHVGRSSASIILHLPSHQVEVQRLDVGSNYFETIGVAAIKGRLFFTGEKSDSTSLIVNESFVKKLGWDQPIGETLRIDSTTYQVVGVIPDFHSENFGTKILPTLYARAQAKDMRYLVVRADEGHPYEVLSRLQSAWSRILPEVPFDGGYQDDTWGSYFTVIRIHATVWNVIATMAVLMTALGLYGLVRLNVEGRVREFSIRKVLGAGLRSISNNVGRQYIFLTGGALLIGAPLGYYLTVWLFDFAYAYHVPVGLYSPVVAIAILLAVLMVALGTQVRLVMRQNPVKGLKSE